VGTRHDRAKPIHGVSVNRSARLIAAAQTPDRPRPMEGEKVL
jgi:hypothetical protein